MTNPQITERGKAHPRLRVVVLTCGSLGFEVAHVLSKLEGVSVTAVITAPYEWKPLPLLAKIKRCYKGDGWPGVFSAVFRRGRWGARTVAGSSEDQHQAKVVAAGIEILPLLELNSSDCVAAIQERNADLGIIAGTYILREATFSAPLGTGTRPPDRLVLLPLRGPRALQ